MCHKLCWPSDSKEFQPFLGCCEATGGTGLCREADDTLTMMGSLSSMFSSVFILLYFFMQTKEKRGGGG